MTEALNHVARALALVAETWDEPELPDSTLWEFSTRMRTSLGRCYPSRRLIRLNADLAKPNLREILSEVVAHEAAHVVAYDRHGPNAGPHGREWAELVLAAGYPARTAIDMPRGWRGGRRRSEPPPPRWIHSCSACGSTLSSLKKRPDWECPDCRDLAAFPPVDVLRQPTRS